MNKHSSFCKHPTQCKKCNRNHITFLHLDNESDANSLAVCEGKSDFFNVLLPSARVKVLSQTGEFITVKILLDSGSQLSLIEKDLADNIKCEKFENDMKLIGVNVKESEVKQLVSFKIFSGRNNFNINVTCAVVIELLQNCLNFISIQNISIFLKRCISS